MKSTGTLVNVTRDLFSNKLNVTLQIDGGSIEELQELGKIDEKTKKPMLLDIEVKKQTRKRSLDANAYFHVLVGKLADKLVISKPRCKNLLIGRYGQQETLENGEGVVIKTNIPVSEMLEQEFLHCYPCGAKEENGTEVVFYKVYRGSHTLDSKEFSVLLEGTIAECKEQGIETLTPRELEDMLKAWRIKGLAS